MKFHIHTYGCQMNERDSDAMSALLSEHGHERVFSENSAELIIVNTCSVREKAEEKAIGKLRLLVRDKKDFPWRKVGVAGCMIQRMGARIFETVQGLDFAIGSRMLPELPSIIEKVEGGAKNVIGLDQKLEGTRVVDLHSLPGPTAFVNIMLGCNMNCAYCIVPAVRGREWSRPASDIVNEIQALATNQVKDVTLLGQSVMAYGRANPAWPQDYRSEHGFLEPFPMLLEAVSRIPGIERVRFTSGHASGFSQELVLAISEIPEVCEHLHLPLQSGSDRILKLMRRGYTVDRYLDAVLALKQSVPGVAITTDIIVGFPSETEKDFLLTRGLMKKAGFDNAFIFKYSSRPGTVAATIEDDVPEEIKLARNRILLEDQERRSSEINSSLVGKVVEVMTEGVSKRNMQKWSGRTRTNKIAVFDANEKISIGDIINMRVRRTTPSTLYCSADEITGSYKHYQSGKEKI